MAQNRINKAGSIFTRVDGLIKGKLIPYNDRPLWYDVYKAFPPKRDPIYRTILAGYETPKLPFKIFYQEDEIRVFYDRYMWPKSKASYLNSNHVKPISDIFAKTYIELAKKGISEANLVRATIEELKTKGLEVSYSDEKPAAEEPLEAKPDGNSPQENLSAEDKQLLDNLTAANLRADETK